MDIQYNSISNYTIHYFKERIQPFIKLHQTKIQIIAAAAFALLAAYWLAKHYESFGVKKPLPEENLNNEIASVQETVTEAKDELEKTGQMDDLQQDDLVDAKEIDQPESELIDHSVKQVELTLDERPIIAQAEVLAEEPDTNEENQAEDPSQIQSDSSSEEDGPLYLEDIDDEEISSDSESPDTSESFSDTNEASDPDSQMESEILAEELVQTDIAPSQNDHELIVVKEETLPADASQKALKKLQSLKPTEIGKIRDEQLGHGSMKRFKLRHMPSKEHLNSDTPLSEKMQKKAQELLDTTTYFQKMENEALKKSSKNFIKFLNASTSNSHPTLEKLFERALEISYVLQRKEDTGLKDYGKELLGIIQKIRNERGGRIHFTPKKNAVSSNLKPEKFDNFILAIAGSSLIPDHQIICNVHIGNHAHFLQIYPQHQTTLTQVWQNIKNGGSIKSAIASVSQLESVSTEHAELILSSIRWYRTHMKPKFNSIKQILKVLINDCFFKASIATNLFKLMGHDKYLTADKFFEKTVLGKYAEEKLSSNQKAYLASRIESLNQIAHFYYRFGDNLTEVMKQLSIKIGHWKVGSNTDRLVLTPNEYYVLNYIDNNALVKFLALFTKYDSKSENPFESILGSLNEGLNPDKLIKIREFVLAFQSIVEGKFTEALIRHRFSSFQEGDILFHNAERKDLIRGEELSSDHKVQTKITGSKSSHVSFVGPIIRGKRHTVDCLDGTIALFLPDVEQTWTTTAYRLNAYEFLTKKGKDILNADPEASSNELARELIQRIYREAIAEIAHNRDYKFWRMDATNDPLQRILSIPRTAKTITKQSYRDIAQQMPKKIICSEHTMRSQVQALLLMEEKIKEKYSIQSNEPLVQEIIPGDTNMKNWHPGRMEKLVDRLVKKGWMTFIKPIEDFPPSPAKKL